LNVVFSGSHICLEHRLQEVPGKGWVGNQLSENSYCCRTMRKQSHQDHFTGSREFITLVVSGEIISQSPEPWSVSGTGLNTYRVCPPTPYRMWSQLQEKLQTSWRLATLQSYQKAACRLRVGKPRWLPDTVNPKKIVTLVPTIYLKRLLVFEW
jgi:hypothetical protein